MNSIALGFADGTAFFAGLASLLALTAIAVLSTSRAARSLANIGCPVSLAVVILSATPLPIWEYVMLFAVSTVFLLCTNRCLNENNRQLSRVLSGAGIAALSIAMAVQELPSRKSPVVTVSRQAQIFVVGDSISAGTGRDTLLWPSMLSDITGLSVSNLALPGANVESAQRQIAQIPRLQSVVILEIGGNDLLGGTSVEQFRRGLQTILERLYQSHHCLVMFELPLYPFKNGFGRAQRDLAKRYGVALIPKRHFTKVLAAEGATSDGLHLSPSGQRLLAETTATTLKRTE